MPKPHYPVPFAEFQAMLEAARKAKEQDRIERELRQHEAAGRALCEQAERARRHGVEYAI